MKNRRRRAERIFSICSILLLVFSSLFLMAASTSKPEVSFQVFLRGKGTVPMQIGLNNPDLVEKVMLGGKDLLSIPGPVFLFPNLKSLELNANKITDIPPQIKNLKNLESLNLYGNALTKIPQEIGELAYLKYLSIGGNSLSSLPPEISRLVSLEELELDQNDFSSLPKEIFELKNLKSLNLNTIPVGELSPAIGNLKKLESLALAGTNLTSLPSEISQLTSLKELYLNDNKGLKQLPTEIYTLKNLERVFLEGTSVPQKDIEALKKNLRASSNIPSDQRKEQPQESYFEVLQGGLSQMTCPTTKNCYVPRATTGKVLAVDWSKQDKVIQSRSSFVEPVLNGISPKDLPIVVRFFLADGVVVTALTDKTGKIRIEEIPEGTTTFSIISDKYLTLPQ